MKARKLPASGFKDRQAVLDHLAAEPCVDPDCGLDVDGCFSGQWLVHGPHHIHGTRQDWRGGGKVTWHCPGKTEETRLGNA